MQFHSSSDLNTVAMTMAPVQNSNCIPALNSVDGRAMNDASDMMNQF